MTDEEKEDKSEQLTIIGMIVMSIIASVLVGLGSGLMNMVGIDLIDNYRLWSFSPFFLIASVCVAYGIIRWAVHFGVKSALKSYNDELGKEAEETIIENQQWTKVNNNE